MSELKPCPLCGGDDVVVSQVTSGGGWGVLCRGCHVYQDTRAEFIAKAVAAWNRRPDAPRADTGWMPITSAPRDGTHILALQARTSFGWFNGQQAPEVQTVVHWFDDPEEPGFYTSVNETEPQHTFKADYWKPLTGLVRDPSARCGRCGARHIEHDLEPVGFTCPDREGVFALPAPPQADGAQG